MTTVDDTDRRIAAWFTDETVRVPERTIDAALAHARAHPRRRDPLAGLRRDPMSRGPFSGGLFAPVPLLAVVGLIVLAALGGAVAGGFFDRQEPALPSPTPTVTPSPSPAPRHVPRRPDRGRRSGRIDRYHRSVPKRHQRGVRTAGRRWVRRRWRRRRRERPVRSCGDRADLDRYSVRHDACAGHRGGRSDHDDHTTTVPGRRDPAGSGAAAPLQRDPGRARGQRHAGHRLALSHPRNATDRGGW